MKKTILMMITSLLLINCSNKFGQYYLDNKGNKYNNVQFSKDYPDLAFSFKKSKDSGNIAVLNIPKYIKTETNFESIKSYYNSITSKDLNNKSILLISYYYKDDFCSSEWTNIWNKEKINNEKEFYYNNIKKNIEKNYPEVIFLIFFEKGIDLKNNLGDRNEYFFSDKDNFLRDNFFKNPAFCGSQMLIKPNGKTLIRNGECRADFMANHLEPATWNSIFNE